MQKGLMELVFPIGSTYVTQSDTNPKDILKFGTWERFKGLIALGVDENDSNLNAIGKKGGEKEHLLSYEELPKYTCFDHVYDENKGSYASFQQGGIKGWISEATQKPHNNLPPYEVTGYIWIRRA